MGDLKLLCYRLLLKGFFITILISSLHFAQDLNLRRYQYISPVPGSVMNMPETNIIIRTGDFIKPSALSLGNFNITGTKSGVHAYKIKLADDGKTILIKSITKFSRAEIVYFNYSGGILNNDRVELPPISFQFKINNRDPSVNYERSISEMLDLDDTGNYLSKMKDNNFKHHFEPKNFPLDFPDITIKTSNNPSPGYFFISPIFYPLWPLGYLMIVDNNGIPIFYQRRFALKTDWKLQPNGLLTFYDLGTYRFYAMDSSYSIVDTFYTGNGYSTDLHELRLTRNGRALLMAFDREPVRMDSIVAGGDSTALVDGLIIQEIDSDKNVIFQWRSWDHLKITDATEDINLTGHSIDYVHGNAIEIDHDRNLLISCRHLDEIIKIDRETGNIIWRWGGKKSRENDFRFRNDPVTFSHQHHIRLQDDDSYTLFDNGNLHSPSISRALGYHLDQENKIANLIWEFNYDPGTYSYAMGSVQKLKNGNRIIGWGRSWSAINAITEFREDGTIAMELALPDTAFSYRAFKFQWKTNLFVTNPNSVFFDSIFVGDSASTIVDIINNSKDSLTITGFYYTDSVFSILSDSLPFIIPPFETVPITINFYPTEYGYYEDILHIRSDTDTSRIAQVMKIAGKVDSIITEVKNEENILSFKLGQNYPNPFNPVTTIEFEIPQREFVSLKIFDIRGRKIANLVNGVKPAGSYKVNFDGSKLSAGVYFYRLLAGDSFEVKKLLLLK